MTKCLVTKLSATVDNSNLKKLGVFTILVTGAEDNELLSVQTTSSITFKDFGNSFYDGTTEKTIGSASGGVRLSAGDHRIEITPKYAISQFLLNSAKYTFDVEELWKGNNYDTFNFQGSRATGDLGKLLTPSVTAILISNSAVSLDVKDVQQCGSLQKFTSSSSTFGNIVNLAPLTSLNVCTFEHNSNIEGNIKYLASSTQLTRLSVLDCPGIRGTVEDFVAMQTIRGRESYDASTNITFRDSGVTFMGTAITSVLPFSWTKSGDNTEITLGSNSTIIHVNSDGSWNRV